MRRVLKLTGLLSLTASAAWLTASGCYAVHTNRSVTSMALVMEVLAIATLGDWLLTVLSAFAASLAFSWYFIDSPGSLAITTVEGAVTYCMMLGTALIGSHLAIRAQRRAEEAIRRRSEMERLQQLGEAILASYSVLEAANTVVKKIVDLFQVGGASLQIPAGGLAFHAGNLVGIKVGVPLGAMPSNGLLLLYGPQPSLEVRSALANLVNLVLDRARHSEESARTEATRRGDEMRTTVLNALAHTFKTPLTSIKAAASMLRNSEEILLPYGRELAAVIDEEADRLSGLIRDSLDLAKLESRQERPRMERCCLSDITHTVTARAERYLEGRSLQVSVPEDLPPIWGDAFLFEQMLTQVVDNAWKYSKPGSEIRISAVPGDARIVLTVHNEGSFVPDDERERIFGKFYRGVTNRSQVEGTGLGLAIARTIAEAHGGSVWLDCEPDGPAFRFGLPVENAGMTIDREPNDTSDRR